MGMLSWRLGTTLLLMLVACERGSLSGPGGSRDGSAGRDGPSGPCTTDTDCSPDEQCVRSVCRSVVVDDDGDGFSVAVDCDDRNAAVYQGAPELCDELDNNCNETVDEHCACVPEQERACGIDVGECTSGTQVCSDEALWGPCSGTGSSQDLCDGLDNDCDGRILSNEVDGDVDGFLPCSGDCDDRRAQTHPGAIEACDDYDNDCDGTVDEGCSCVTGTTRRCGTDLGVCTVGVQACSSAGVWGGCSGAGPSAESCDGRDNDCDGSLPVDERDADFDGLLPCAGDCDDRNAVSYPGAVELCDLLDNDCDGSLPADERDVDSDGVPACAGDCDDTDADTHPGATELCDRVDNDCVNALPSAETDGDGDGTTPCEGDCNDRDSSVFPGAAELCDGVDNDCSGGVAASEIDGDGDAMTPCEGDCNDNDPATYLGAAERCDRIDNDCTGSLPGRELDGDGDGYAPCEGDCDDGDPGVRPGAAELCDGLDNNCAGGADDGTCVLHDWDRLLSAANSDETVGTGVDASGNAIVTGNYFQPVDFGGGARTGSDNAFAASWRPDGTYLWDMVFPGSQNGVARAVAVDPSGNMYIAGKFWGTIDFGAGSVPSAGQADAFVVSYSSSRARRWQRTMGGIYREDIFGLAVDAAGNSYIAGSFQSTTDLGGGSRSPISFQSVFVASYDRDNVWRWDRTFASQGSASSVVVDGSGRVFVGGTVATGTDFGGGARATAGGFIACYLASNGNYLWDREFGTPTQVRGVEVGSDGHVLATGLFTAATDFGGGSRTVAGSKDVFVASFAATDGNYRWDRRFGGTGSDTGRALAVDAAGRIFVVGSFSLIGDFGGGNRVSVGGYDVFVLVLDPAGGYIWDRPYGSAGLDLARSVSIDRSSGAVYVAGYSSVGIDFGGGPTTAAGNFVLGMQSAF